MHTFIQLFSLFLLPFTRLHLKFISKATYNNGLHPVLKFNIQFYNIIILIISMRIQSNPCDFKSNFYVYVPDLYAIFTRW